MGKKKTELTTSPLSKDDARAFVESIKTRIGDIRKMLIELHDRFGWKVLGYDSWEACVTEEFGWSKRYANMQISAGKIEQKLLAPPGGTVGTLVPTPPPTGPIPEKHLRPLAALPEDQQVEAYLDAKQEAEAAGEKLTAKAVIAKVELYAADNESYVAPPEPEAEPEPEPTPTVEEAMAASNKLLESKARQITAFGKDSELQAEPHMEERMDTVQAQARTLAGTVRSGKGAGTCTYCDGEGCKTCLKTGWLDRNQLASAPEK